MQLSQRLGRITESQAIKMAKLSRELKAQGVNIIDLSIGEPDFRTPEHICAAATDAMNKGYTKYPPVAGIPELKEAICVKLQRDNNLSYTPAEIVVSTGAKQALANAILCLIDAGDEAIIPTPFWVTYGAQVSLAGGAVKYVKCSLENDFKITPQQLEAAISERTKLFIFSSPCNPTGSVYTRAELAALVPIFKKYPNVTIISDEIYEYINYGSGHESIAQFPELREQVVVINGMSKGFAMTGWRLGYMAAPKVLAQACEKLQGQFTSGANSISQRAGVVALLSDLSPTWAMRDAFHERRDYIIPALRAMPGVKANMPEGAFYAFPDISAFFGRSDGETTITDDESLAMYLLHKANVATVYGSAFGDSNCIRLSFAAAMPLLEEAMGRMAKALGELR